MGQSSRTRTGTSGEISLTKGRIAGLSPLATANGLFRPQPSNKLFLCSWAHVSQLPNGIVIGSAVCRAHERDQQTDRQTDRPTDHATSSVAIYLFIYLLYIIYYIIVHMVHYS